VCIRERERERKEKNKLEFKVFTKIESELERKSRFSN